MNTPPITAVATILVVDDDEGQRRVARAVLEAEGFEVHEAADGIEALESIALSLPDIVVLDVEMPRMNGFDCCRELRSDARTRLLPIMMSTGLDDTESVTQAYAVGATDFTTKPTNWTALPHQLRFLLRAARNLRQVREYAEQNDALLRALPDRVMRMSVDGEILESVWTEPSADPEAAAPPRQFISSLVGTKIAARALASLREASESGQLSTIEYEVAEDHAVRAKELRSVSCGAGELVVVERDVTEAREAQARLRQLAYIDSMTGLPNRTWLLDDLDRRSEASSQPFAMLFIDLDQFRLVNDLLGYDGGNEALTTIAERIAVRLAAKSSATADVDGYENVLVRLGGDRFAAICPQCDSPESLRAIAANISAAVAQPMLVTGQELVVTTSIGSCWYPDDGTNGIRLLQNAEMAAREAKSAGRNTHYEFTSSLRRRSAEHVDLVARLRRAIENDELQLHFQPKISLSNGRIKGFEALLRWHCARDGWVAPMRFIPVAEESGLIIPLTEWVLRSALRTAQFWHSHLQQIVPIAVNISARQFALREPAELIAQALRNSNMPARCLEIELTESAVMIDIAKTVEVLTDLRGLGIRSSIDDFGTGHSSLAYLRDLPVDAVKIDRSFVTGLDASDSASNHVCQTIVTLSRGLGFEVIAEGVETRQQQAILRAMGCDQAQGYLFARPMDVLHALNLMQGASGSEAAEVAV